MIDNSSIQLNLLLSENSCFVLTSFSIFQIALSKKWGFTKWEKEEYEAMRADGRLKPDGCYCHYFNNHGPFKVWEKNQRELRGLD